MLQETINTRLISVAAGKRTHRHYKRTVDIAKLYMALSTGVGIEDFMKMYSRREDANLFKVRCSLTEQITPSILNSLSSVLEKGYRSFYRRELSYGTDSINEKKTAEFEAMIGKYAGGMGIDGFCQARVIELQSTDPNTWIVQEWKDFDNIQERAEPYPFESSAEMSIDFEFERGDLQYLTVLSSADNPKDASKPLKKLTCYQKNIASVLVQIGETSNKTTDDTALLPETKISIGGENWAYFEYYHGLNSIAAKRVGYRRDKVTAGDTFVWPYEASEPYLKQTLKVVSELQLTAANVAMPQTVRFGDVCSAPGCDHGHTDQGGVCKSCNGTGKKKSATSVMEEIVVTPMPESAADMIDLSKIIHYVSPDVSILQWQQQYVDALDVKCMRACLGSDTFTKSEVAQTATGRNLDQDNANDFVYKYFKFYADFWQFTVYAYADIVAMRQGLNAQIVVNKDLKLKTLNQLLDDLKQANDSGAGPATRQAIEWDIMRIVTLDSPHEFEEYQVRERFNPFSGFTDEQKMVWSQSPLVPIEQRVLYANLGYIFDQLEFETPNFYKLPYDTQKTAVEAKVAEYVQAMQQAAPQIMA